MAETKKARARSTRSAPKADLIEMAAATAVEAAENMRQAAPAEPAALPAGAMLSSVREQGDSFRQAMSAAVAASAQGALEVNGKILEALQSQSNAAIDLWRTTLNTPRFPEAFDAQTAATRQAYETASAQWKDIAETTARWFIKSLEPLQSSARR